MKVVGFCGWSGAGKTTLIEALIPQLRAAGRTVSVVKHAHQGFDIDQPGKDSWRQRQAGAFEVVIASNRRLAKLREYQVEGQPTVHQLIAELCDRDWVLVEGFRDADIIKLEVWRAATGKPVQYPFDPFVAAVCTADAAHLPQATGLPVLDLNDAAGVARFLLDDPKRYAYPPIDAATPAADAG
jgi:molybdopterin-guanine dinucleotide biosynthesis protein B